MLEEYICKKCGYDTFPHIEKMESSGRKTKFAVVKADSCKSFYDGSVSGHRWIELITCRRCGNIWEVRNSDI